MSEEDPNVAALEKCLESVLKGLAYRGLTGSTERLDGEVRVTYEGPTGTNAVFLRLGGIRLIGRLVEVPPERQGTTLVLLSLLNLYSYDGTFFVDDGGWACFRVSSLIPVRHLSSESIDFMLQHLLVMLNNTADWLQQFVSDPELKPTQAIENWPILRKGSEISAAARVENERGL